MNVWVMLVALAVELTMNGDADRKIIATQMVDEMRNCAQVMNDLVANALILMQDEEANELRVKAGEFLGYIYCDIYHKGILSEFPELSGSLEA